jgi:hypothetical protein
LNTQEVMTGSEVTPKARRERTANTRMWCSEGAIGLRSLERSRSSVAVLKDKPRK